MATGSLFLRNQEHALRHVTLLAKGLRKVAIAGLVGGVGCGVIAALLGRFLEAPASSSNAIPGFHELSGIGFVAAFMATALIGFSVLYLIAGWGLSHQKPWARYMAAGTFLLKVLLCVWLGRSSFGSMFIFLLVASWDIYGLWVLLSKETGLLFTTPETSQVSGKPANLVT